MDEETSSKITVYIGSILTLTVTIIFASVLYNNTVGEIDAPFFFKPILVFSIGLSVYFLLLVIYYHWYN